MVNSRRVLNFIDLFAGCGGLSLGLSQSGFKGLFAVEKAVDAFATFEANLIDGPESIRFEWPSWLERRPHDISKLIASHAVEISALARKVDVVAGGPPCQGFSFAGLRNKDDRRNTLFRRYVDFVAMIQPRAVILENVPGMRVAHKADERSSAGKRVRTNVSYFDRLLKRLDGIGYVAEGRLLRAVDFGVPQLRPRLVVIAMRKDVAASFADPIGTAFNFVESSRATLLSELGLEVPISAEEAISDLALKGGQTLDYPEQDRAKGFRMLKYTKPVTPYQILMHDGVDSGDEMDSMRLARHTPAVQARFEHILKTYPKGVSLNEAARTELGLSKHRTCPMKATDPAPTLTTLPDDLLHYQEPRILTVREMARLQSFPDWFKFRGKYTTGGERRKIDCPRYTQVGNAVPPLMARAIGLGVMRLLQATDLGVSHARNRSGSDHRASMPMNKQGSLAWTPK